MGTGPTHNHTIRQQYGWDLQTVLPGEAKNCPDCFPAEWVAAILRRDIPVEGSNVCVANVDRLAATLVEELCLAEWFTQWDEAPRPDPPNLPRVSDPATGET